MGRPPARVVLGETVGPVRLAVKVAEETGLHLPRLFTLCLRFPTSGSGNLDIRGTMIVPHRGRSSLFVRSGGS